jgi:hypothetical protein
MLLAGALAFGGPSALAADAPPPPAAPPSAPIAGWNDLVEGLRTLPDRVLAKLPGPMRGDPQVQQEVARLILESLASSTIEQIGGDGDHPAFLPQISQVLNIGQPNADTIYRTADVTSGGTYRLRGKRGSIRILTIGEIGRMAGPIKDYHDLNTLHVDAEGRFDVLFGPTKPDGYRGDWWQLAPTTTRLLLRMVSSDWGREQDPTIAIERVDIPVQKPRTPAADLEQRLRRLPSATAFMAQLLVAHAATLRQQGYVNKLEVFDVSQMGGLTGQFYYEGAYELRDDEALIVEAKAPAKCLYRSLILTNEIYETTDWYNNLSSLNDAQAKPDRDGVLRIVVSAKDPGVPNWLDTAGYPQGAIQGRWTGCDSQPIPSVQKVMLADVRKALPPETPSVTPAERQAEIRDRRAAYQQRPLW